MPIISAEPADSLRRTIIPAVRSLVMQLYTKISLSAIYESARLSIEALVRLYLYYEISLIISGLLMRAFMPCISYSGKCFAIALYSYPIKVMPFHDTLLSILSNTCRLQIRLCCFSTLAGAGLHISCRTFALLCRRRSCPHDGAL